MLRQRKTRSRYATDEADLRFLHVADAALGRTCGTAVVMQRMRANAAIQPRSFDVD